MIARDSSQAMGAQEEYDWLFLSYNNLNKSFFFFFLYRMAPKNSWRLFLLICFIHEGINSSPFCFRDFSVGLVFFCDEGFVLNNNRNNSGGGGGGGGQDNSTIVVRVYQLCFLLESVC